jgi:hypothetical protein
MTIQRYGLTMAAPGPQLRTSTCMDALIHAATAIGLVIALAATAHSAAAEDSFGTAIDVEDLADIRGGDNATVNSHNTTTSASSTQGTNANNEGNTITAGGSIGAGNFTIQPGGLSDNHGMTNAVVNTAPQANVQGIMSLNLVLQ